MTPTQTSCNYFIRGTPSTCAYICCLFAASLQHVSHFMIPIVSLTSFYPMQCPQQHPSVEPTRCWWRCKPPVVVGFNQAEVNPAREVWQKVWFQQLTKVDTTATTNLRRNLQPWSHSLLLLKMINIYQTSMALGFSILNEKTLWDSFGPLSFSMGSNILYTIILRLYSLYIYMCHGINSNLWISDCPQTDFWLWHICPHNKYHVVAYMSRIQVPFVHWV